MVLNSIPISQDHGSNSWLWPKPWFFKLYINGSFPPSFVGPIGNLRDLRRFEIVGRVLRPKTKKEKRNERENFVEEEAFGKP